MQTCVLWRWWKEWYLLNRSTNAWIPTVYSTLMILSIRDYTPSYNAAAVQTFALTASLKLCCINYGGHIPAHMNELAHHYEHIWFYGRAIYFDFDFYFKIWMHKPNITNVLSNTYKRNVFGYLCDEFCFVIEKQLSIKHCLYHSIFN